MTWALLPMDIGRIDQYILCIAIAWQGPIVTVRGTAGLVSRRARGQKVHTIRLRHLFCTEFRLIDMRDPAQPCASRKSVARRVVMPRGLSSHICLPSNSWFKSSHSAQVWRRRCTKSQRVCTLSARQHFQSTAQPPSCPQRLQQHALLLSPQPSSAPQSWSVQGLEKIVSCHRHRHKCASSHRPRDRPKS